MAKVEGPLFSIAASGTFRNLLLFRTNQSGTHVAKPISAPTVRSSAQLAQAQAVRNCITEWNSLAPATKTSWNNCGLTYSLTGYQLFWSEWFLQGSSPGSPPIVPCP